MLNKAVMSKFGIRLGEVTLAFYKPIFLSYPVPNAVSPRFGLGAQANIRSTM